MLKSFMPLNKKMRLFAAFALVAAFALAGNKYLSGVYSKGFCDAGQSGQAATKTKAVIF